MRLFLQALKAMGAAVISFAALLFCYALSASPCFSSGERHEFYLGNSSSAQTVCASSNVERLFLTDVAGESVRYRGDVREQILKEFLAEVRFTESVSGVENYYCYSPRLGEGVQLNGQLINLHVAYRGGQTAAGTPLIFGGF